MERLSITLYFSGLRGSAAKVGDFIVSVRVFNRLSRNKNFSIDCWASSDKALVSMHQLRSRIRERAIETFGEPVSGFTF